MMNLNRRTFINAVGLATATQAVSFPLSAETKSSHLPTVLTGNGEWTYEVVPGWGSLPAGTSFAGTHGAIAQDKAGRIYVRTQSATRALVYARDRTFIRTIT